MKTVTLRVALVLAAVLLSACDAFQRPGSLVEISLPAIPSPRASVLSRGVPAALDSCELLINQGGSPVLNRKIPAAFGAPISITVRLMPGFYDIRIITSSAGVATGIAFVSTVEVLPGRTTEVLASLSALAFAEPLALSGAGPGDPLPRPLNRVLSSIPEILLPLLQAGTPRLRVRTDRDPSAALDSSADFTASLSTDSEGVYIDADIPAGTALGNETARYWFTISLPHAEAVFSDCLIPQVNGLLYDGATLSGLVEGGVYIDDVFTYRPEQNASIELSGSGSHGRSTDALGTYVFGSVNAGTYTATMTVTDTVTWSTYLYGSQAAFDGGGWIDIPANWPSLSYANFSLSPGGIHTLNFQFTGY